MFQPLKKGTTNFHPAFKFTLFFLITWIVFCYGYFVQYSVEYSRDVHTVTWKHITFYYIFYLSPVIAIILFILFWKKRQSFLSLIYNSLEKHTEKIDEITDLKVGLWIFLAACLSLYTELMIIRLHSSYIQLFAYFKNISLLSCFLGLGVGYAMGGKRPLTTPLFLPLLTVQLVIMYFLSSCAYMGYLLQNPVPEELSMGMDGFVKSTQIITVYVFLIMVFVFNALCFIPLGHLASYLMMRKARLISYSWNLAGSLLGIIIFTFLSFAWTPPVIWLLFTILLVFAFLSRHPKSMLSSVLASVLLLSITGTPLQLDERNIYSPYQLLTLKSTRSSYTELRVNNVYFQRILDNNIFKLKHYDIPYYFKEKPEDVLIVGSGTGNDVAAAIKNNATHIDAVEIDPAILEMGKLLHPKSPYQSSRVNAIVNDARAYIRHTNKKYDLIVYGLLDSHTLLSNKAGVRLDSYVYTVEAFREAREKLKKGGVISMTFSILEPGIGRKIFLMLQEAFDGQNPVVYETNYDAGQTFLIGEDLPEDYFNKPIDLNNITYQVANTPIKADKSTDDWPFLYMSVRKYPLSYVIMIVLLFVVSLVFIRNLMPGSSGGFSWPCFFLGAGFMLIETKSITELALVYGSTWIVIGIVISAILVMAFLANLLVMKKCSLPSVLTYGLLFVSIFAGLAVRYYDLNGIAPWLESIIKTAVLTLPLFFSGIAFSSELDKTSSVSVALSSNLLGAMLGGFFEYNSMYFGFGSLYIFALVMYVCAFAGSWKTGKK